MSKRTNEGNRGLEAIESRQMRKHLSWGIGIFLVAVVLLLYSRNPRLALPESETWLELLLHISMALLISSILIVTVEVMTRRFYLRRIDTLTKRLSEDMFATVFEQFTPPEIKDEVINSVFKTDFYYKNCEKDSTAQEVQFGHGALLQVSSVTKMEIHNPTNEGKEYVSSFFLYDIDTVDELPPPKVDSVTYFDENNNVLETFTGDALAHTLKQEKHRGQLKVKTSCPVPAYGHVIMRRSDTAFLRQAKDYLDAVILRPTVNFRLSFRFPNSSYKFWCLPQRPRPEDKDRCKLNVYEKENRIEVEAKGGLLPYQGLMLQYVKSSRK